MIRLVLFPGDLKYQTISTASAASFYVHLNGMLLELPRPGKDGVREILDSTISHCKSCFS